ncbi:MAG TPA: transcription elongation factor GreA [Patescibacteria group bacterium]|nr:transcription elongation factor GreA [Patescibacteria group bacterium]
MSEEQIISPEGYKKLQDELDHLVNVKRKEIASRIEKAKELGDLSENAEYHEAKDAQAFNEGRIAEINNLLKNVRVVENNNSKNKVSMGSTVTITDGKKEKTYSIVSFNEVDPAQGKISNESPIGTALLDKKKGDDITISTPKGKKEYKIKEIK